VLGRNGPIASGQHRRPASSYIRWEREEQMAQCRWTLPRTVIKEVSRSASGHIKREI
jgi:hypothetical protein